MCPCWCIRECVRTGSCEGETQRGSLTLNVSKQAGLIKGLSWNYFLFSSTPLRLSICHLYPPLLPFVRQINCRYFCYINLGQGGLCFAQMKVATFLLLLIQGHLRSNYFEVNIMSGIMRRRKVGNYKILKTHRSEKETGGVQRKHAAKCEWRGEKTLKETYGERRNTL